MNIVLLTNNDLNYPVLHSQLLEVYKLVDVKGCKTIFCKNKGDKEIEGYTAIRFDITKIPFINYIWYILSVRKLMRSAQEENFYHVRGFVSGVVFFFAYFSSRSKPKYIYDPRGAFLAEKKESNSIIKYFSIPLKIIERLIISRSAKTVVTSNKFRQLYCKLYGNENKYIVNYNCSSLPYENKEIDLNGLKEINIIYVGAVNYWHDIKEITSVIRHVRNILPEKILNLVFLTSEKNHEEVYNSIKNIEYNSIIIDSVPYEDLGNIINKMHIGISVVRPTLTGSIASPIKIADYILAGLVVISNRGIGDFDDYYIRSNSAVLYDYSILNFTSSDILKCESNKNKDLIEKVSCDSVAQNIKKLLLEIIGDREFKI